MSRDSVYPLNRLKTTNHSDADGFMTSQDTNGASPRAKLALENQLGREGCPQAYIPLQNLIFIPYEIPKFLGALIEVSPPCLPVPPSRDPMWALGFALIPLVHLSRSGLHP